MAAMNYKNTLNDIAATTATAKTKTNILQRYQPNQNKTKNTPQTSFLFSKVEKKKTIIHHMNTMGISATTMWTFLIQMQNNVYFFFNSNVKR